MKTKIFGLLLLAATTHCIAQTKRDTFNFGKIYDLVIKKGLSYKVFSPPINDSVQVYTYTLNGNVDVTARPKHSSGEEDVLGMNIQSEDYETHFILKRTGMAAVLDLKNCKSYAIDPKTAEDALLMVFEEIQK